jgi:hypothetical protein
MCMFVRFRLKDSTVSEVNINLNQVMYVVPEGSGSRVMFVNGTCVDLPDVSNQAFRGAAKRALGGTKDDESEA